MKKNIIKLFWQASRAFNFSNRGKSEFFYVSIELALKEPKIILCLMFSFFSQFYSQETL